MEGDNVLAKGGGGGFLHLFDWKRKPRRKLFANNSPEGVKQVSRAEDNYPSTNLQPVDNGNIDDDVRVSTVKETNEFRCAAAVAGGEQDGVSAPGIVARLMGLNSLPSPAASEPCYMPFVESESIRDGQSTELDLGSQSVDEHWRIGAYSTKLPEQRFQRVPGSPIEKFQRERLPSRTAKSLPGMHSDMLSPIRSPRVTLSKDAARIMKCAAKILETEHQVNSKGNAFRDCQLPLPLRLNDSQERSASFWKTQRLLEWSKHASESSSVNNFMGGMQNIGFNASQECNVISQRTSKLSGISRKKTKLSTPAKRDRKLLNNSLSNFGCHVNDRAPAYMDEDYSLGSETKRKSVSLAIQAKINVQRREGLRAPGRDQVEMVQDDLMRPPQPPLVKYQVSATNDKVNSKSPLNNSVVLKQNNQKQNCLMNNNKLPVKHKILDHHGVEVSSRDSCSSCRSDPSTKEHGKSKSHQKGRKQMVNGDKETPPTAINFAKRKQSSGRGNHFTKSELINEISMARHDQCIQSHVIHEKLEQCQGWKKPSIDIVSFTFSTPMVKQTKECHPIMKKVIKKDAKDDCSAYSNERNASYHNKKEYSSPTLDSMRGDALSILLDQMLQELSLGLGLESSVSDLTENNASPTASVSNHLPYVCDGAALIDVEDEDKFWSRSCETDGAADMCTLGFSSVDDQVFSMRQRPQVAESCQESNRSAASKEHDYVCSGVFTMEDSSSNRSCPFPEIFDGSNGRAELPTRETDAEPSNLLTLVESQNEEHCQRIRETLVESQNEEHCQRIRETESTMSGRQEIEYMQEILLMVKSHLKHIITCSMGWVLDPFLFDLLEFKRNVSSGINDDKAGRLKRKVVFDCISECLDTKCCSYFCVGYQSWIEGVAAVRCGEISEEIHKEILGWDRMANWMVDELVEKDMSGKIGCWLVFEIEKFEMGVEIQNEILGTLVAEVVDELLVP